MTEALKAHLENNPQIETVYFNEKGDWQFHERADYDTAMSREEVLAPSVTETVADETEEVSKTKQGKTKAAKVADETEEKNQQ